jgi:hypothetical protein
MNYDRLLNWRRWASPKTNQETGQCTSSNCCAQVGGNGTTWQQAAVGFPH